MTIKTDLKNPQIRPKKFQYHQETQTIEKKRGAGTMNHDLA